MKRIVGISSLTLILALVLYLSFPGRHIDMKTYDVYSCIRGSTSPPTEIVIVGIDEESFSMMKLPWPWPRSIHGKLIRALGKAGVRGIVMDIIFSNPSAPKEDKAMAEAITEHRNVVLAADIEILRTEK
ncbi:MAG: CHASE2 domain-containing protein, partial [Deltaproteobacteria bacterium]